MAAYTRKSAIIAVADNLLNAVDMIRTKPIGAKVTIQPIIVSPILPSHVAAIIAVAMMGW